MTNRLLHFLTCAYILLVPFEIPLTVPGAGSLLKWYGMVLLMLYLINAAIKIGITRSLRIDTSLLPMMMWFLVMAVSLTYSSEMSKGIDILAAIGIMLALTVMIYTLEWDERWVRIFENCLAAGIIVLAVIFIITYRGAIISSTAARKTIYILGSRFDPNKLSGMLLLSFIFFLNRLIADDPKYTGGKYRVPICVGAMLISLYAVLMTTSRGALVSLVIGVFVYFYCMINSREAKVRFLRIVGAVLALGVIILVLIMLIDTSLIARLNPFSFGRNEVRLQTWAEGIGMLFAEFYRPLIGYGVGTITGLLGVYFEMDSIGLHNTYLRTWLDAGIFSVGLYIAGILIIFRKLRKIGKPGCAAMLAASSTTIFFLDAYDAKYFWSVMVYAAVLLSHDALKETAAALASSANAVFARAAVPSGLARPSAHQRSRRHRGARRSGKN